MASNPSDNTTTARDADPGRMMGDGISHGPRSAAADGEPARESRRDVSVPPVVEVGAAVEPPAAVGRPWQFGMRTVWATMTLLCMLFALMSFVGALWSLFIGWFLILIAAHVFANAWCSRAREARGLGLPGEFPPAGVDGFSRDRFSSSFERRTANGHQASGERRAKAAVAASASHLGQTTRLGKTTLIATSVTSCVGAAVGLTVMLLVNWDEVRGTGLLVGTISAGVIGAILGFLGSGFCTMAHAAWRDATVASTPPSLTRAERSVSPTVAAAPAFVPRPDPGYAARHATAPHSMPRPHSP